MCAQEMTRSELIDLLPLDAIGPASLTVEETSLGRLYQKLVGIIRRCGNVGVEAFVADLRDQGALFSGKIAMLSIKLIPSLVEICRGGLWGKGIQPQVIQLLRIDRG